MKEDTKKAFLEFIKVRDEVDELIRNKGISLDKPMNKYSSQEIDILRKAFMQEREAKIKYYTLLFKDMSWPEEELDSLLEGSGLRDGICSGIECWKKDS